MANPNWLKGVSGNPSGTRKTKPLSDQLRMLLAQNPGRARNIAEKLITMAEEGDLDAAKVIMDRLEGKPLQQIEVEQTITNMTPEDRRQRVIELQAKVIGGSSTGKG